MPRLRANRPHRVRARLTVVQVEDLLFGSPFAGPEGAFGSAEARRTAWFAHRAGLLEVWELQDPPLHQQHPAGLIDYEQPELAHPPARKVRKVRGLRILTREQVVGRRAE